jgi:hypothetical protein
VDPSPGQHTPPRFLDLLRVLCEHEVEFVLIGGLAVGYHGYRRATKDVDIVPEQSRDNLARLWRALVQLQARPAELDEFRAEEIPMPFSLDGMVEGGGNWAIYTRFGRLDVMQWVKGIESYDALRADAETIDEPAIGYPVQVAGVEDLIAMKEAADRDLDRIDVTALRMAHGLEE